MMGDRFSHLKRLLLTVRHLRVRQIAYQIWYRLYPGTKPDLPNIGVRSFGEVIPWVEKPNCWEPGVAFSFLNERQLQYEPVEWEQQGVGKLWLYNLHYFDCLGGSADLVYEQQCAELIADWVSSNENIKGTGWEPYPTSLRIVNWIKWHLLSSDGLNEIALQSLAQQTQWLYGRLEYHILANHLFANAKALVFAGLFFDGKQAEDWLKKGVSLVNAELKEQILEDGAHFELSPMYHATLLEDVLDLINLANSSTAIIDKNTLTFWCSTAQRMSQWQLTMLHPDGEIAFFNDAALGIARTPKQIDAYFQKIVEGVNEARNFKNALPDEEKDVVLPSGYAVMQRGPFKVIADVAKVGPDYQPGHAHADSLSCELSVGRDRLFVNSGTSTYVKGELRNYQRSTAAHNTLQLCGVNSSDVWDGFRVARRAYPLKEAWLSNDKKVRLLASHDGYRHFQNRPIHRREWVLDEESFSVADSLEISKQYREEDSLNNLVIVRWLLHPAIIVGPNHLLRTPSGWELQWQVSGGSTEVVPAFWYPEFGVSIPTQCLETTASMLGENDKIKLVLRLVGEAPRNAVKHPLEAS